jgi:hypothetical protein
MIKATVAVSPPSSAPSAPPVALELEPSPGKGSGSPGRSTLELGSVVLVVVELMSVELVASGRVVEVVLLVARVVVVVDNRVVELDDDVGALVMAEPVAATTTTPVIPWLRWILQK